MKYLYFRKFFSIDQFSEKQSNIRNIFYKIPNEIKLIETYGLYLNGCTLQKSYT